MHLCVSSKYLDLFNLACKLVEDLLLKLYEEYRKYSERKGIICLNMEIKRIDGNNNLVGNINSYGSTSKKAHSKQNSK